MATTRDRRARLATSGVFLVQGLTLATLLAQVAALQDKHDLSEGSLTVLLLVVPVIAGIGSALAGAFAARHGSRAVLRLAQPLACLAVAAAGWAPNLPALLVANTLFGLCLGAVDAGMNMQAVTAERAYGRAILTGFHAVWSAAAVLAALWASAASLLGLTLPVTVTLAMAVAVAASLTAIPVLYTAGEEHTGPPREETPAAGRRVRWRPILPLCLAMAFLYVGDATVANFGAVYLHDVHAAAPAVVPLALGAYQAATFLVRTCGDLAVRRYGPAAVVRLGGGLAALGFAGLVAAPGEAPAIAAFAVTGVGLAVVAPQSFSAAGRLDPAGTGVAIARVNMFNYVGFVAGAGLVGGLASAWDFRVAFAAPMLLAAAIVALAPGFARRAVPDTASGTPRPHAKGHAVPDADA